MCEGSIAIGPNPFVPGKSDVVQRLQEIDRVHGTNVYEFYKDIIERGGTGGGGSRTGILLAATAERSIKRRSENGPPMATIVIYDAVGNVVYRSKPNDIALAEDGQTFGFVWDGKNNAGRTVGPGTYLVRISGTQTNNRAFKKQKRIGVTIEGKIR